MTYPIPCFTCHTYDENCQACREATQFYDLLRAGKIQRCANGEYFAVGKTTTDQRQAVRWALED